MMSPLLSATLTAPYYAAAPASGVLVVSPGVSVAFVVAFVALASLAIWLISQHSEPPKSGIKDHPTPYREAA